MVRVFSYLDDCPVLLLDSIRLDSGRARREGFFRFGHGDCLVSRTLGWCKSHPRSESISSLTDCRSF